MDARKSATPQPSLPALFWSFAKIGAFTIGGGYAMVPLIRAELVQSRAWLPDEEFAEILGLSQAAPGAIAINTATFAGYRLRGLAGALVGCLGVVLPSFGIILLIATLFGRFSRLSLVERMFRGMRPAIVGLILAAVIAMGRSILRTWRQWAVAGALFILIVLADPHPVLVLAAAGLIGCFLPGIVTPATRQTMREGPRGIVLIGALIGLTLAFITIGALTFGGGYAMIPLIQRIIITQHGWLSTTQFLDIVAIAEMTPGPIAVNSATFVGYRVAGLAGATVATLGVVLPFARDRHHPGQSVLSLPQPARCLSNRSRPADGDRCPDRRGGNHRRPQLHPGLAGCRRGRGRRGLVARHEDPPDSRDPGRGGGGDTLLLRTV